MEPLVIPIIFFAFLIQTLIGFGAGLIAMPFLIALLGVSAAAPLFSLVGMTAGMVMLLRYRAAWDWAQVWRLSAASVVMIPPGVWLASVLDEHLVMIGLGIFTTLYAVYALFGAGIPKLKRGWGYIFGMASGLLHGAYNTGGPPLVIYGSSQRWEPAMFKGNIQGLFLINGTLVIGTHFLTGHYTSLVMRHYVLALPAIALALVMGFALDRFVEPQAFRKGVLVLLVIVGLTMIF